MYSNGKDITICFILLATVLLSSVTLVAKMGVGAGGGAVIGAAGGANSDGFEKLDRAVTAGLTVIGAGVGHDRISPGEERPQTSIHLRGSLD
jgi:hypothetical protein